MKKYIGILIAGMLCVMMMLAASAADTVVYVNDGGAGDGSSESAPLGSMSEAITKVADGGKVVIVDTYTCAEEFYEPEHNGDIIITGGKYIYDNGERNRWFLSGPGSTTFENITFECSANTNGTSLIVAQYFELILGEGITTPVGGKCYVVGGYQVPFADAVNTALDSHITVKSGDYWAISGFNRGTGEVEFTGTSHITVTGGSIATLYGACINGNFAGNSEINISGGQINNVRAAGDATRRLNGNSVINISGGIIGLLSINNVMGTATVNFTGGNIAQAEKTVEPAIQGLVTDGTATLNVSQDVDARIISLSFDVVNYIGGGTVTTPEVTTDAPVTTPEVTTAEVTTPDASESTTSASEDTSAPESSDASTEAPESSDTTEKETTKDTEKTSDKATTPVTTTATSGTNAEEGGNVGLIVGIVAAVIVVAIVVVVIIKKKKN